MIYRNRDIHPDKSIIEALKQMDTFGAKLLIVVKNDKFVSLLSVGDIQRAIIQNKPLKTKIVDILRENVRVLSPGDSIDAVKQMMLEYRMELCPVVNNKNIVEAVYYWEDLFLDKEPKPAKQFIVPVVIMAGGMGTRLKPLTNVLPKALFPVGEKSIIEEIIDRFGQHGCQIFFISVNYKAGLVEFYLQNQNLPYKLEFFKEKNPMGTAGSLSLLKGKITQSFFVSNCDILIEQDYSEILDYHLENNNEITIVAALKHYPIPYGTIETGENGRLLDLKEKPEFVLKINSGMYILEPHILNEIPDNIHFNITQLIKQVKMRNGKIGAFPVSEKSWKDIGNWKDYTRDIM